MAKPKPLEKMVQTGFRMSEEKKRELERVAKLRGQSVQSLIDESVELRLGLTEGFWDQILLVTDKLKITPSMTVANMVVKQSCFQFAWLKVFGKPHPNFFKEFRFDSDGFMTGERLSEVLVEEYTEKLEKLKANVVEAKKHGKAVYRYSSDEMSALLAGQM